MEDEFLNKAKVLYNLGVLNEAKGYYENAIEAYISAAREFEDVLDDPNSKYLLMTYQNLAAIYYDIEDFKTAIDYYLKAASIKENTNNLDKKLANYYFDLSNAYYQIGYLLDSEKYLIKCGGLRKELFKDNLNCEEMFLVYNNLGELKYEKGELKEAFACLNKAKEIILAMNTHKFDEYLEDINKKLNNH